jgi:hypothetical protein
MPDWAAFVGGAVPALLFYALAAAVYRVRRYRARPLAAEAAALIRSLDDPQEPWALSPIQYWLNYERTSGGIDLSVDYNDGQLVVEWKPDGKGSFDAVRDLWLPRRERKAVRNATRRRKAIIETERRRAVAQDLLAKLAGPPRPVIGNTVCPGTIGALSVDGSRLPAAVPHPQWVLRPDGSVGPAVG